MSLIVKDKYRTHPWSHIDGGVTVCVQYEHQSGNNFLKYIKVKSPKAFMRTTLRNHDDVKKIWIKDSNEVLFELD